jgi:beta-carotene 3-hydroxylase
MVSLAAKLAIFAAAYGGMEGFAWVAHRYVMHGALWCWHRSHHEPRQGVFELNDLFAVVFAAPAIVCIWLGVNESSWWLPLGLGITAYGATYFLFHDGLVHRRFPVPLDGRIGFWRSRLQAHRLHHAVATKHGCVSFGFLWVRPARELKSQLSQMRRLVPTDSPRREGLFRLRSGVE